MKNLKEHWNQMYQEHAPNDVSWYQIRAADLESSRARLSELRDYFHAGVQLQMKPPA